MVAEELKNIFLSASIPSPERDTKYYDTADVIAIRDAVIALATIVLPRYKLIWGGHPSITPLIYCVLKKSNIDIQEHVILYQSKFFEKSFPKDNDKINNVILTDNLGDKDSSLKFMRQTMFKSHQFNAGVFIGGMEGVEEEYELFKELQPTASQLPLASTGAAAKILYDRYSNGENPRLCDDYAYMSLFQDYLIDEIK